jgi:hypothetical protein
LGVRVPPGVPNCWITIETVTAVYLLCLPVEGADTSIKTGMLTITLMIHYLLTAAYPWSYWESCKLVYHLSNDFYPVAQWEMII